MKFLIDSDSIFFNHFFSSFEVASRFDTLNFAQEVAKQATESFVIVHYYEIFTIAFFNFNHTITFFNHPFRDQLTVTHVCLFDVIAKFDTSSLSHQTVLDVSIVLSFVSVHVRKDAEVNHFLVSHIVKTKQVSTCFFDHSTISAKSIWVNTRSQFTRTVTKTFVKVSVEVVCQEFIFVEQFNFSCTPSKFFSETATFSRSSTTFRDIVDSYRF